MRTRTALTGAVALLAAVGSFTPALAKATPKPIKISYDASAYPDPTSTDPVTNVPCRPNSPVGMDTHPFTVPAAGVLDVALANTLDWSLAVRDADGNDLASSDGGTPTDKESVSVSFKKGQKITINACNFSGEPSVHVSGTFTFKR
jgi:hypothetical protein